MIAERSNNAAQERCEPVDRRLRNYIIAGNAIVWLAIIGALIFAFS